MRADERGAITGTATWRRYASLRGAQALRRLLPLGRRPSSAGVIRITISGIWK